MLISSSSARRLSARGAAAPQSVPADGWLL